MNISKIDSPWKLIALATFAVLAAVALLSWQAAKPAAAQEELGMALAASGSGVSCSAGECDVPLSGQFDLAVVTNGIPSGGYVGVATQVVYAGLTYNPAADSADEWAWPENTLPVRFPQAPTGQEGAVAHGGLTSVVPPFAVSTHEGDLLVLGMTCTPDDTSVDVYLAARSSTNAAGAAYSLEDLSTVPVSNTGEQELDVDGNGIPELVPVASTLTINCTSSVSGGPTEEPPGEEDPTQAPQDFPTTGTGPLDADTPDGNGAITDGNGDSGSNAGLIAIIAVIAALAAGGAGFAGWRYWKARQTTAA